MDLSEESYGLGVMLQAKLKQAKSVLQGKGRYQLPIVEFRIPGYPGPSKERDTEVRLVRGKIVRGKIRMYLQTLCCSQLQF